MKSSIIKVEAIINPEIEVDLPTLPVPASLSFGGGETNIPSTKRIRLAGPANFGISAPDLGGNRTAENAPEPAWVGKISNHFQAVIARPSFPSSERDLQLQLIINPPEGFPNLCEWEWDVVDNMTHLGKGDLVFASLDGSEYLVVETKYHSLTGGSGKNMRTKRTKQRQEVREQASKYALAWQSRHPTAKVFYATLTNEQWVMYGELRVRV
jgi:hypothetical protein